MKEEILKMEIKVSKDDLEIVVYLEDGVYSSEVRKI